MDRILIVEDETLIAMHLMEIVRSLGYDPVARVSSAEEAVAFFDDNDADVVLMDVYLSGDMDGIQAAEKIRQFSDVPIIFITAFADDDLIKRVNSIEPYGYVLKPYQEKQLKAAIEIAKSRISLERRLRATERSLAEQQKLYRFILDNMEDTLWMMDMDFRTTFITPSVERTRGYTLEELQRMPIEKNMTPESAVKAMELIQRTLVREKLDDPEAQMAESAELEFYRKDGSTFWTDIYMSLVRDENGRPKGFLGVGRDISKRKLVEAELERYRDKLEEFVIERTAELREAQEQLVASERFATIGRLASGISHELRNPLGIIISSIYLLKNKMCAVEDTACLRYIGQIENATKECENIIRSVLSIARIKQPEKQQTDFSSFAWEMRDTLTPPENVTFEWNLPQAPASAMIDSGQIRIAFNNIIQNAFQALEKTGGRLEINTAVTTGPDGRQFIETTFTDNGPGISAENISKIFDPFFTTKAKGFGFGLPLVKSAVEGHDGSLTVASPPGGGVIFTVCLPAITE